MTVTKRIISARSSDGLHDLSGVVYLPEESTEKVKGFFHIVHGMTEHIARYEKIMTDLSTLGYIVFGYDNLGHGNTAKNDEELGFISKENGWDLLARDVKVFYDTVRTNFQENAVTTLPYILMGHSMGSFIVRVACEKYVKPDKLIIMGTGGSNHASDAGLALVSMIKKIKGEKYISPLLEKMAFGSYNKHFGKATKDDTCLWLTNDESVRKKYYEDKFCTFKFTVSAMGDLIRLTKESNRTDWYKNISKQMPIILLSGENDPVGNYGKGVIEIYNKLKKYGANVDIMLYKGARHEILNDFTYNKVKDDIIQFCEKQ